jgi:hypothetical protein
VFNGAFGRILTHIDVGDWIRLRPTSLSFQNRTNTGYYMRAFRWHGSAARTQNRLSLSNAYLDNVVTVGQKGTSR